MRTSKISRIHSEALQIDFIAALHSYVYHNQLCFYCGEPLNKHNRTRDHLIPKTRAYNGHITVFRQKLSGINLVHSCHDCNNMKGCKSLFQFRQWLKHNKPKKHKTIIKNIDSILIIPIVWRIKNILLHAACFFI